MKTFLAHDGALYCTHHVPKPKHTQVADSVSAVHAANVPKRVTEGLGKVGYNLNTRTSNSKLNQNEVSTQEIYNSYEDGNQEQVQYEETTYEEEQREPQYEEYQPEAEANQAF